MCIDRALRKLCLMLVFVALAPLCAAQANQNAEKFVPIVSSFLLSDNSVIIEKNELILTLMIAQDTDSITLAWAPGSDGETPADQIQYEIYLSTNPGFTPDVASLKKTVTGVTQADVYGLTANTLYFARLVARYPHTQSLPSKVQQARTFTSEVQINPATVYNTAEDLGLGLHSTSDNLLYTYTGGTPPPSGSVLFSEDENGGMTLRTVDSASNSGGLVYVNTSPAQLTDIVERGTISSSFHLFDVAARSADSAQTLDQSILATRITQSNGNTLSQMVWKNKLLVVRQTNYVQENHAASVQHKTASSAISTDANASSSEFDVDINIDFEPEVIADIRWGQYSLSSLDSAHIAAKGTLSMSALARYQFTTAASVSRDFELFSRNWASYYTIGVVPVYQLITLSVSVVANASASAAITAETLASLTETVEVGARYDGHTWTPYITHDEDSSLTATLNIGGTVNADIRIVPKIEIGFYTVLNSSLSVEPMTISQLRMDITTDNVAFVAAHPSRAVHLTKFDVGLGMEANVAVNLETYDDIWDALAPTCVLGTEACLYPFDRYPLFSIPSLTLSQAGLSDDGIILTLDVKDGLADKFNPDSIFWEVFPDDAVVNPSSCIKYDTQTRCTAYFITGNQDSYTVFASGQGVLGEVARQFREIVPFVGGCEILGVGGPEVISKNGLEWQRCPIQKNYTVPGAESYCQNLALGGFNDWRWPTADELKGLVYCSSGKSTPLQSLIEECPPPVTVDEATCCITNTSGKCIDYHDYTSPTISPEFELPHPGGDNSYGYNYYTSDLAPETNCSGEDKQRIVDFDSGASYGDWIPNPDEGDLGSQVMCVRNP